MKVGRREFLKLFGSAAVGAVAPKGLEEKSPAVVSEGWHHLVQDQDENGAERLYVDGEGPLSLEEYAKRLGWNAIGFDAVIGNPPWQSQTEEEKCNCPACQAALREYDCDFYLPISQGTQPHEWVDPLTGAVHHATMEWYDHGLHTMFRVNGFYLGEVLSREVPDPSAYLKSIWSCGLLAAAYMIAGPEESCPPVT